MGVVDAKEDATCYPSECWLDRNGFVWATLLSNIQSNQACQSREWNRQRVNLDYKMTWSNAGQMRCLGCSTHPSHLFCVAEASLETCVLTTTLNSSRRSPPPRIIMFCIVGKKYQTPKKIKRRWNIKLVAKCQMNSPFYPRLITWERHAIRAEPIVPDSLARSFFFQDKNLVLVCLSKWLLINLFDNISKFLMWYDFKWRNVFIS